MSNSNNLNNLWVVIFTRQGHINQVYWTAVSQWVSDKHSQWSDSSPIKIKVAGLWITQHVHICMYFSEYHKLEKRKWTYIFIFPGHFFRTLSELLFQPWHRVTFPLCLQRPSTFQAIHDEEDVYIRDSNQPSWLSHNLVQSTLLLKNHETWSRGYCFQFF